MKIKSICLALVCSCLATVGAETIDIYETWKGQAFDSTDGRNRFTGFTAGNTYTLSANFTFTNSLGVRNAIWLPNSTTFDFSDGNHVLGTGNIMKYGGANNNNTEIVFKGGTWDVGGNAFTLGGWYNLCYDNVTYTLDGTIITNLASSGATLCDGYGAGIHFIAKNGARYYGGANFINLCPATPTDVGTGNSLGRLIEFTDGSKFFAKTSVFDNRNTNADRLQYCTIRFAGSGTVATGTEAGGAGNSDFYLGHRAPGYRLEVIDGALFDFRYLHVGGHWNNGTPVGEYGHSNSVYVANSGEMRNTYSLNIGEVPGADHNSFLIDDGGTLALPTGESVYVGTRSAFNSFTVTNGTVTAKTIYVGYNANASNNIVRLVGDRSNVSLSTSQYIPFNLGVGNSLILDGGFRMGSSSMDLNFTPDGVASTGNIVCVDGGAVLTSRYIRVANVTGSVGNTFHIGSGATVVATELTVNTADTTGNTLCISNGTFNYTGDYGLHCSRSGNVCRMAGESPKVRYVGEGTGVATFRYGVELQYDLTGLSVAYAEPAILVKWFQMHSGTHLTFNGIEDAADRLSAPADFVLARATDDNKLDVPESVIEEAKANLPDCSKLRIANDGHDLVLRVRPLSGGLVIFVR